MQYQWLSLKRIFDGEKVDCWKNGIKFKNRTKSRFIGGGDEKFSSFCDGSYTVLRFCWKTSVKKWKMSKSYKICTLNGLKYVFLSISDQNIRNEKNYMGLIFQKIAWIVMIPYPFYLDLRNSQLYLLLSVNMRHFKISLTFYFMF